MVVAVPLRRRLPPPSGLDVPARLVQNSEAAEALATGSAPTATRPKAAGAARPTRSSF